MILFDVTLAAHPGQEEALAGLLRQTMAACVGEVGCLRYRFMRDMDDPAVFHLTELWADETALHGHATGEPFRAFLAALPGCGAITRSEPMAGVLEPYAFKRPSA